MRGNRWVNAVSVAFVMNRLLLMAWLVPTSAEAPFLARDDDPLPEPQQPVWVLKRPQGRGRGGTCDERCSGWLGGRRRVDIGWGGVRHWDAADGVRAEDIRRVIANHRHTLRYCYEQALVTRPELEGRLAIRFVIGESGAVTESTVTENDLDADVGDCVAGRVALMPFPSPGAGAMLVVNYPFVFHAAP